MERIAFLSFNTYEMLLGGHQGNTVGGAQLQQILVGKELARRGYDVVFVEYDSDGKSEGVIDGIEIVTKPRPAGSEPRRAFEAFTGTVRTLRKIEPDVCYRRVINFELIPISFYCSLAGVRFVYGISHDDELTDNPHMFSEGFKSTRPYKRLNRYVLSNADAVIAQNEHQYDLAMSRLDTDVRLVPNCYPPHRADPVDWQHESPVVFWAARFQPWKHPEVVAQLAEELDDIDFIMAGGPGDVALYSELEERARSLGNLHLLGHVPLEEIDRYFAAADVFLNTSDKEGFPNTFLQAWANETPVVSLQVDPNDVLATRGIGITANGSFEALRDGLAELVSDEDRLEARGRASNEYLDNHHSLNEITDKYERVLFGSDVA